MPRRAETPRRPKLDFDPSLLTKKQIAQRLNVSVMTIHRWTVDKTIPTAVRRGRVIRYDLADCLEALGRFKVKSHR